MSAPFKLEFIGGMVEFGSAPLLIMVVSSNGGGAVGNLGPAIPPKKISCSTPQPVTLAGSSPFVIQGTTETAFGPWDVTFEFPGPPAGFANQGNLNISSVFWELTGKYRMVITDKVTGEQCAQVVETSGEYQFEGPALSEWPHSCSTPALRAQPQPQTNSLGQSPGLTGGMILRGHAGAFPTFFGGILATHANSLINLMGFGSVTLNYKLTY